MNHAQLKDAFTTVIGEPPPARFDVDRAIRNGRRRRALRRAAAGAVSTVAAAATVAAVTVGAARWRGAAPSPEVGVGGNEHQVVTPTALPTGFPYATDAQDHGLPNSNYPRPADLAAVRLPKSKPGVYYEVQSRGMYALTKGAGPACYGLVYLVRTTPPDRDGQAQVTVTDCPAPVPRDGVIEGARVIGHVGVAGVTGLLTDFRSEPVLYFTTGEFTTRIQAPGLTRQQLVALGDALTGLR